MDKLHWSEWYPLSLDIVERDVYVPDQPGIYEIRTDYEFGRLKGNSRIVYIGSAARGNKPSLKERLVMQRIINPKRYLSRAEKLLQEAGHNLDFRFATGSDRKTAKHMEAQRLMDYERQHWELPPGNGVLPQNYL